MNFSLGSLFDGSGGFPLSGFLCGIEPKWASEVEPYPIAVTRNRFPNMKHLGDISKINGAEVEPVDIISFGSPCQDLSVAGKRAGLKHADNGDEETTRSGLFMEAVRIIKEMRGATNGEYPKFALWENVPGAFSSNKGEDFRIVLEELIKIVEPSAVMPEVPQKGWSYADSYCGDGWSLAYRVFDAQYWGVPQRRRRIYLVADFRGECAREILFEREGLRGYFTESRTPWQTVTEDAEGCIGTDDKEGAVCYGISSYESNSMKSDNPHSGVYEADTSRTLDLNGGNPACNQGGIAVVENVPYTLKIRGGVDVDSAGKAAGKGALIQENMSATLGTSQDQYLFQPVGCDIYNTTLTGDKACSLTAGGHTSTGSGPKVLQSVTDSHILDDQGGSVMNVRTDGKSPTIRAQMGGHPPVVMIPETVEGLDAYNQTLTGDKAKTLNSAASDADHVPCAVYSVENHPADSRVDIDDSGKVQTLTSRMGTGGGNVPMVMEPFSKSRRAKSPDDFETWKHGKVANCLNTFDNGDVRATDIVVEERPVYCLQGNGIDRADTAGCNGKGWNEETCYTLNTVDRPAVAYGLDRASFNQGENAKFDFSVLEEQQPTLTARGPGAICHTEPKGTAYSFDPGASRDVGVLFIEETAKTLTNGTCPGHHDGVVISQPLLNASKASFFMNVGDEGIADTLVATDYKDPQLIAFIQALQYIVRRLTPTECARLQGFADKWGHIEPKDRFTEEELRFWQEVRDTYEIVIKGKDPKDLKTYNEKQMLTWYNKLHTDSAEYKMWGNGIALPTALYCMQGIADVLTRTKRSTWLDDLLGD